MATRLRTASPSNDVRRAQDASVLSQIRQPDIMLTLWDRPVASDVRVDDRFEDLHFETAIGEIEPTLLRLIRGASPSTVALLASDAAMLGRRFGDVMHHERVQFRLERLTGDACRKFHADFVTARLLCTYCGSGTEWRWQPTLGNRSTERMRPWDVGLFKGRLWAGKCTVLHRSPPIAGTGEVRLLLAIDSPAAVLERERRRVLDTSPLTLRVA